MTASNNNPQAATSERAKPLRGRITVPGDKSISHRALMLASQALGLTTIDGLLEGEDVLATANALRLCNVPIERRSDGTWIVSGVGIGGLAEPADVLDMGNAGTAARLMMGLLSSYPFHVQFTGDASLRKRPMKRVMTPLEQIGAQFWSREGGRLPLAMRGAGMPLPITYELPVASAQVKSAILLAGLNTPGTTTVIEREPTRDHTERMLGFFGVDVESASEFATHSESSPASGGSNLPLQIRGGGHPLESAEEANSVSRQRETGASGASPHKLTRISVTGQPQQHYQNRTFTVPADPSSAAFPLVAALLVPDSEITITNVCLNPTRTGLLETLREMGATIRISNERDVGGEPVGDITARYSTLKGVEVPPERAPSMIDEYPILAIAAACANGTTTMRGLSELRVKESDRLAAIVAGLIANGIDARAEGDDLIVKGNGSAPRGGGTVTTHFDHRIAMSFLVLGLVSEQPVTVDDTRAIATSFPGFMELMAGLGADLKSEARNQKSEKNSSSRSDTILQASDFRFQASDSRGLVIAVDGPAASGKGTLARRIADHLGCPYLDTGSLYRAVGMRVLYANHDPHDLNAALEAARTLQEHDLANPKLRGERIGQAASIISAFPEVRQALLEYQRNFAKNPKGAVLDGRDIGTVICPDADVKFFITATLEARAKRRHKELQDYGVTVDYQSVFDDLLERDQRDESRHTAPMTPADDAILLDTSRLGMQEVFELALQEIARAMARLRQ